MRNHIQDSSRCSNLFQKFTLWTNFQSVLNLSETTNSFSKNHGVTHFFHSQLPQPKTMNTENSSTTAQRTSQETILHRATDVEHQLCNNNGGPYSTLPKLLALKLRSDLTWDQKWPVSVSSPLMGSFGKLLHKTKDSGTSHFAI